jgi:hypothetical protein
MKKTKMKCFIKEKENNLGRRRLLKNEKEKIVFKDKDGR